MKIFNSLGRKKNEFIPLVKDTVSLYVCGMTVYDYCHLGHARVVIFFDIVRRWFEACNYKVVYVRNITDIDDKIIARAKEKKISIKNLTDKYVDEMQKDFKSLGIIDPSYEPRATSYVPQMLELIDQLMSNGYAYESNGDVNFSVRKFKNYGKLSGKSLNELRAGERVTVDVNKRDPLDFVLWKKSKPDEPIEACWDSCFGRGRPGWHIECSAMSRELLGTKFDIHGGGIDLQFPHHENEIAQSEGASKCSDNEKLINTWMHVGFVTVQNEKMSKSLGNFSTIRNLLEKNNSDTLRFFLLKGHYRSPINYSDEQIKSCFNSVKKLYKVLENCDLLDVLSLNEQKKIIETAMNSDNAHVIQFKKAMNDDFNTPKALSILFSFANEIKNNTKTKLNENTVIYRGLGLILGFFSKPLEKKNMDIKISNAEIDNLVSQRILAKKNKNFDRADEIRGYLNQNGIVLEDDATGTRWKKS